MVIRIPLIPANRPWFNPANGHPVPEFARVVHDLVRRTGGQNDDYVAAALETAAGAAGLATASATGLTVPVPGGAVELVPSNPLSATSRGDGTATIAVAGHTRTGAGAALIAANVSPNVAEGQTYYVYYTDAGNAGGAQTFVASTDASDAAGLRYIGAIAVSYTPNTSGVEDIDRYRTPIERDI